jgi:hypothetical protein
MRERTPGRRAVGAALTAALLLGCATACTGGGHGTGSQAVAAPVTHTPVAIAASVPAASPSRSWSNPPASGPGRGPRPHHPQPQPGGGSLDAVAARLVPYLQRHFGAAYAALLVDDPHDQLVVYRLPDPRLDSAAGRIAAGTRLSFVVARYSFDRQLQLLLRIAADQGYWKRHGITVNSWGATNGVHCGAIVTTTQGSAAQQQAFNARYGTGAVIVAKGGPIEYK